MAMFVHLAPADAEASIRRSGVRPRKTAEGVAGVYVMPVLPSYVTTYQWLRELKRWTTARTLIAVQVRIPDDEPVRVGRYNRAHLDVTAAESVAIMRDLNDARGHQVFVPRALRPNEIHRIRQVDQGLGWRYQPDAHDSRPCVCPVCIPHGAPYSRRLKNRLG